jgi:hypothetical protein
MANGYVQHIRYQKTHIFSLTLTEVVIHYDTIEVVLIGSQNQQVELLSETELLIIGLITANVSVLAEVGAFRAETVRLPQKHHRSRNVDDTTNAPILANTCYQQPFYQLISNF